MQTKQSPGRFVLIYFVAFLFVVMAASIFWFFSGRYTAQLIQTIEDNTSIECLPVSVDYSILTGRMVLEKPELRISPGITLKSDEIIFSVNWTSLWTEEIDLKNIKIIHPHVHINSDLLGRKGTAHKLRLFLNRVGRFQFESGDLSLNVSGGYHQRSQLTLPFRTLVLNTESFDQFRIEVLGEHQKWQADGMIFPEELRFNGQLSLSKVPLQSIFDLGYLNCNHCDSVGELHSDLSVEWIKNKGLELEGTAMIGSGYYRDINGVVIAWDKLLAEGFQYQRKSGSVKSLSIQGGQLIFNYDDYLAQLGEVFLKNKSGQFERIVFDGSVHSSNSDVILNPAHAVIDFERDGDGFLYQASGNWNDESATTIEGRFDAVDSEKSRFKLVVNDIDFADLMPLYRTVSRYDLSGSQADLFLDAVSHKQAKGLMVFDRFVADTTLDTRKKEGFTRLKALLTDSRGLVTVRLDAGVWSGDFLASLNRSLSESIQTVVDDVPDYLRHVITPKPLQFHIPVQGGQLSESVKDELDNWAVMLKQRPLLGIAISVPEGMWDAVYQYLRSLGIDKQRLVAERKKGSTELTHIQLRLLYPSAG